MASAGLAVAPDHLLQMNRRRRARNRNELN